MSENIEVQGEVAPTNGWAVAGWLQQLKDSMRLITPLPWSVREDPARPDTFYLSGPPGTEVVADGLRLDNASALATIASILPELVDSYESLLRIWDELVEGPEGDLSDYYAAIRDYQLTIAQLEGDPTPIPPVEKAGDITFMHIGSVVLECPELPSADQAGIQAVGDFEDFVRITIYNRNVLVLPKDYPMKVRVIRQYDGTELP